MGGSGKGVSLVEDNDGGGYCRKWKTDVGEEGTERRERE